MEKTAKIGDYYCMRDIYISEDNSTALSIVLHKVMRQYLFSLKFSKDKFDFNYHRAEKEKSKNIQHVIKQLDSYFTNNETFIFLEFFDSGNIIEYIKLFNRKNKTNIPHKLVHHFMKEILNNLSKINKDKLYLIDDIFLDNLYLSQEKYTLDLNLLKANTKQMSSSSFINQSVKLNEITNDNMINSGLKLSVRLLVSFKREFSEFFNITDYKVLKVHENNYCTEGQASNLVNNLGLICYYLLNNNHIVDIAPISRSHYNINITNDLPAELIDFIQKLLIRESSLQLEDVLEHPYVKNSFENLTFPFKDKEIKKNESLIMNYIEIKKIDYNDYIIKKEENEDSTFVYADYVKTDENKTSLYQINKEIEDISIVDNTKSFSFKSHATSEINNDGRKFIHEDNKGNKLSTTQSLKEEHIYIKPHNYQDKKFSFKDEEKSIQEEKKIINSNFIIENYFDETYMNFKCSVGKGKNI